MALNWVTTRYILEEFIYLYTYIFLLRGRNIIVKEFKNVYKTSKFVVISFYRTKKKRRSNLNEEKSKMKENRFI